MAQQNRISSLALLFVIGTNLINAYSYPFVGTTPRGRINKTVGNHLNVTCTITVELGRYRSLGDVPEHYREFFFKNCTSNVRLHSQTLGSNDCTDYNPSPRSCTYSWTHSYRLSGEGEFEYGCFNSMDLQNGCSGGNLLRVMVSHPEISTAPVTPTTTDNPTTASTTNTDSGTTTTASTTYTPTSHGSSNSVTVRSPNLTSSPDYSTTQNTRSVSKRDGESEAVKWIRAGTPPIVFLIIVLMTAFLCMFWKCRRRRSPESTI